MAGERVVRVSLVIDETGAVKALRTTGDESGKTESKLEHLDKGVKHLGSSFGGLKTMIGGGLGLLGAGGVAYGLKDIISNTQELAESTEHFHAVSGIGAQQSLYTVAALKARGISAEAGGKAFGFLTKNLQTAERQWHTYGVAQTSAAEKGKPVTSLLGTQATAFQELGLNVGTLSKMSGGEKIQAVVKAFEHMSAAMRKAGDQGRLMKQIFGKSGEGLATVLDGGALGLTHFEEAAKKYFPTIQGGMKGLEEWQLKQSEFKLGLEGLEATLGLKLIPILSGVESWFSKVIFEIEHGHGTWGVLYSDTRKVVGWLGGLKNVLIGVGAVWGTEKVLAFAGALKGLTIISTITGLLKVLTGGDLLLTAQVGFLDAAAGAAAFMSVLLPLAAAAAATYGAIKLLDKVLPEGDRPENLLGGNQPGEKRREGEIVLHRIHHAHTRGGVRAHEAAIETAGASPAQILHEIQAIAKEEHTTKIDLHMGAAKVAEQLVRNPHSNRAIAEGVAHYTSKMAARGARR